MNTFHEALSQNLYVDRQFNIDAVKILPGEFYVTSRPMLLVTVLGSCVAACIRDTSLSIGGMNHFMLPSGASEGTITGNSTRYGTYAMEVLINEILKMGGKRQHLEAKVFGGGAVLKGLTSGSVGQKNADFVLKYLHTEGIRVVAQDLLDIYPRRVHYFPHTGKVLVKKLRETDAQDNRLINSEQEYSKRISTPSTPTFGDIELFT